MKRGGTGTDGGDNNGAVVATLSSEHGTVVVVDGAEVTFGRDAAADVRIGAMPVYDNVVPRRAGRLFAVGRRVVVENLDDQLAFDLRLPGRPLMSLPPGDWHAPSDVTFDVVVAGGVTSYELTVRRNLQPEKIRPRLVPAQASQAEPALLDPPTGADPKLTERQRAILDAYVQPLSDGGLVASHQQVAERLAISRSLVRVECQAIWSALFLAGVPMRDLGDARDEIVDAWSRHRF